MSKLTRNLGICAVVATLGLAVIAASPSSAHAFYYFHHFHHWHEHWRFHWRFHFGSREHWFHQYRWAYHFGGYRHVVEASAPRACQPGFHLGYRGEYCWPNR